MKSWLLLVLLCSVPCFAQFNQIFYGPPPAGGCQGSHLLGLDVINNVLYTCTGDATVKTWQALPSLPGANTWTGAQTFQEGASIGLSIPLPTGMAAGTVVVATNGASGSDCVTGGGANHVFCEFNGTAWQVFAGGGTGITGGSNAFAVIGNGITTGTSYTSTQSPRIYAFLVPGTGGGTDLCAKWNAALLLLPASGGTVDLSVGFADPQFCPTLNPYNGVNNSLSSTSLLGSYRVFASVPVFTNSFRHTIQGMNTGSGSTQNGTVWILCNASGPLTCNGSGNPTFPNGSDTLSFSIAHGPFPAGTYAAAIHGGGAGVTGGSSAFGEQIKDLTIDLNGLPNAFAYYTTEEQELSILDGINVFDTGPNSASVFCDSTQVDATGSHGPGCTHFQIHRFHFVNPTSLSLTAVAAASGGTTQYTGTITGGATNAYVGGYANILGFTNGVNNGTFLIAASTATTITLVNASGVAETHAGLATVNEYGIASEGARIQVAVSGLTCTTYPLAYATVSSQTVTIQQTYYGSGCAGTPACTVTSGDTPVTAATCSATLNSPGAGQVTIARTGAGSGYSNGDGNAGTVYIDTGTIAGKVNTASLIAAVWLDGQNDSVVTKMHCETSANCVRWGNGTGFMQGGTIDAVDGVNAPTGTSNEVAIINGGDSGVIVKAVDGTMTNLVTDEMTNAVSGIQDGSHLVSWTKTTLTKALEVYSPFGVQSPSGLFIPEVTFANLPACSASTAGLERSISDSNTIVFNAIAAGASTNHVAVRCNGTNWVVF